MHKHTIKNKFIGLPFTVRLYLHLYKNYAHLKSVITLPKCYGLVGGGDVWGRIVANSVFLYVRWSLNIPSSFRLHLNVLYYYWGEGDKKAVNNGMSTRIKKTEGKICTIWNHILNSIHFSDENQLEQYCVETTLGEHRSLHCLVQNLMAPLAVTIAHWRELPQWH